MIESIECSNCGAPLDVAVGVPYTSCTYCGSRLAIKNSDGVYYSEVLTQIDKHTGQMANDLQFMRLRQELEHLDAEWQRTNGQFLARKADLEASMSALRKRYEQGIWWVISVLMLIVGLFFT